MLAGNYEHPHNQDLIMKTNIEQKRINIFLLFAFGITWTIDLIIYLTGGLKNFSVLSPTGALMTVSMAAPALAHILTRWITKEGWKDLYLRPRAKKVKRFWLMAWLGTPLLVLLGFAIYFLILPQYFDPTLATVSKLLTQTAQQTGKTIPLTPAMFLIVQVVQAILISPIVNGLPVLGEEFGWRAYLLAKLVPYGWRRAMLEMGIIWGVWHWPVIFMGYEYGLSYPGAPWLGALIFLWFTFIVGTFLGWLTLQSRSVWPAVIAHSSINGIALLAPYLVKGQPNPLIGPSLVGLLGSLPFTLMAIWLLSRSRVFAPKKTVPGQAEAASVMH